MGESAVGRLGALLSWPLYYLEVALHFILGNSQRGASVKYLQGNFRPVSTEVQQEGLEVEGDLPSDLSGCFLRIGPNPAHKPVGAYHWFDGDGLVHACRIKDGTASYANRWVQTKRFLEERQLGWPSYTKLGDLAGFGGLLCLGLGRMKKALGVNVEGKGTGNTAMVYHAKRLLALYEGDMPYALRVACQGVVETVERVSYGNMKAFTAHPKVDQKTGHMHFFGYDVQEKPYCTYAVADESGKLVKTAPIDVPQPVMMHDFAITANYSIFIDTPLVFSPEIMVKEGKIPFVFEEKKGIRFGLRPHAAAADDVDAVQWFELPSQMIFHVANAWEEGEIIHLYACAFKYLDLNLQSERSGLKAEEGAPFLSHYIFDTKDGSASVTRMTDVLGDFPQINQRLAGTPTRFVYCASDATLEDTTFRDIAKYDLHAQGVDAGQDACCGLVKLGDGRAGGEAIFVPRSHPVSEDDGYLLTYVYDEGQDSSEMVVYDAKTMSSTCLARVKLPQRVPFGFHALFLDEAQMLSQE